MKTTIRRRTEITIETHEIRRLRMHSVTPTTETPDISVASAPNLPGTGSSPTDAHRLANGDPADDRSQQFDEVTEP